MSRFAVALLAALGLLLVSAVVHAAEDALACPSDDAETTVTMAPRDAGNESLFSRPEETVPANKRTSRGLYLTAQDAYDLLQEDAATVLFIDVRTRGELQFIGMPTLVDAHVPYLIEADPLQWDEVASSFKLVPNVAFVAGVDRRLTHKRLAKDA